MSCQGFACRFERPLLLQVLEAARRYLDNELADDPTIAGEGTALYELERAVAVAEKIAASRAYSHESPSSRA